MSKKWLELVNVSQNNLKNIDQRIPLKEITIITGVSGSGKSSLAFDTVYAEGQRRFIEVMNLYVRNILYKLPDVPVFDSIEGLSPTVGLKQSDRRSISFRSTVGTISEIYDFLRLIYTNCGSIFCPECNIELNSLSDEEICKIINNKFEGEKIIILTPAVVDRKGEYRELFEKAAKTGFVRVYIDDREYLLPEALNLKLDRNKRHNIDFVVDRIKVKGEKFERILKALRLSARFNSTITKVLHNGKTYYYNRKFLCPSCSNGFVDISPRLFSFNSEYGMCRDCDGRGLVNDEVCPSCKGNRLNKWATSVKIADYNITEITALNSIQLIDLFKTCSITRNIEVFNKVFEGMSSKLKIITDLGIEYLEFSRPVKSISGGELQKLLISRLVAGNMSGLIYVFDEPSIGLHPEDCKSLKSFFLKLKELGNTLIIIEHEREIMKMGDYFIDFGIKAGLDGGKVEFSGSKEEFYKKKPVTCRFLEEKHEIRTPDFKANCGLKVIKCSKNNLNNIDVFLPKGRLTCITGVSGAGKSSLIDEFIANFKKSDSKRVRFLKCKEEEFKFIRIVDKEPIGRSVRSTPVTYTGIFDGIRKLYSNLEYSKIKGYKPADFSFNSNMSRGRCEKCKGLGRVNIEMKFLPSYSILCNECSGKRFNSEIQRLFYNGMNISQVLEMTVTEARVFFERNLIICQSLEKMEKFGLGYLCLGQPSSTLSGGEVQRIKIVTELLGNQARDGIYILEEPTTGLHFKDTKFLMDICMELKKKGNTIIIIDNTYEILVSSDWLIELGPGASKFGGELVYMGFPSELNKSKNSLSYKYLIKNFTISGNW